MKKLLVSMCIAISMFMISCTEKSNALSHYSDFAGIDGIINNWNYGLNFSIMLNGQIISNIDSNFIFEYFSISKVSPSGTFKFSNILTPPDSLFHEDFYNTLSPLRNRGIFADTIHPFMHDYAVIDCITFNPQMHPHAVLYAGNTDKGYLAFISPKNPVGTYSVIINYVDRNYSSHYSKSQFQDGYYITWEYNLHLKKGWNVMYIKQANKTNNTMLISIDQKEPESPYFWHISSFFKSSRPLTESKRDRITGRLLP